MFKRFYYQSEIENKNIIMTHPKWQIKPDTIGDFGCLLIAKLNAYNCMFSQDKKVKELNDEIIANRGYEYLRQCEVWRVESGVNYEQVKKACFGKESFLVSEVINKLLKIESEERNYTGMINIQSPIDFFLIRTKYLNTGHYSLIVNRDMKYFDSYNGVMKTPEKQNILEVIRIRFGG